QKADEYPMWVEIQQSYNIMKPDGREVPEKPRIPNEMNVGIAWQAPHIQFKERQLRAEANNLDQELRQWWKEHVATHTDKNQETKSAAEGAKTSGKPPPLK